MKCIVTEFIFVDDICKLNLFLFLYTSDCIKPFVIVILTVLIQLYDCRKI